MAFLLVLCINSINVAVSSLLHTELMFWPPEWTFKPHSSCVSWLICQVCFHCTFLHILLLSIHQLFTSAKCKNWYLCVTFPLRKPTYSHCCISSCWPSLVSGQIQLAKLQFISSLCFQNTGKNLSPSSHSIFASRRSSLLPCFNSLLNWTNVLSCESSCWHPNPLCIYTFHLFVKVCVT